MKIERTTSPSQEEIDFLTQQINQATPDQGQAHFFAFFIRDDQNQIIAGCNGCVFYASIHTDQLWVHADYRGRGMGRQLMNEIDCYGRELGCHLATLITMSFQNAQEFYENLGYECDFKRPGYEDGSSCIFLRKLL